MHQIRRKICDIYDYERHRRFQIKRHSWQSFQDYNETWGTGIYEGDLLKVPRGLTVRVKYPNIHAPVHVPDDNRQWDPADMI
jgi:hypothetical protein